MKRPVKKVCGGVVGFDGAAAGGVELEGDLVAGLERGGGIDDQGTGFADLLDAGDGDAVERAGVAGLAAHLGVENGLVGDDEERVFLRVDFEDRGFAFVGIETEEFGDGLGGDVESADDGGFLGGARTFLLFSLAFLIASDINRNPTL